MTEPLLDWLIDLAEAGIATGIDESLDIDPFVEAMRTPE